MAKFGPFVEKTLKNQGDWKLPLGIRWRCSISGAKSFVWKVTTIVFHCCEDVNKLKNILTFLGVKFTILSPKWTFKSAHLKKLLKIVILLAIFLKIIYIFTAAKKYTSNVADHTVCPNYCTSSKYS